LRAHTDVNDVREQQLSAKKMGCSNEHPLKLRKNYRFFAAFFFAPLAAFFAIVFSSGLATQPPTTTRPSQLVG
jgi:hypothetical protein